MNGKIFKLFFNENIHFDYKNEQFDYLLFKKNISKNDIKNEFQKFLTIYQSVFYNGDRFLTVINSYEIRLNIKDVEQLVYLYKYTFKYRMKYENLLLTEFLFTYWKTINYAEYKKLSSSEVFKKFFTSKLLNHLKTDYEDLHGMGKEYLMQYFDRWFGEDISE